MEDLSAGQGGTMSERPQYALRFISGKYQGGEFPLKMNRDVVIGRSSDLDMVLVEDMVSRKHAKISMSNGQVIIQDMGSTNGTFVNGEKIKRVRLREGDRILIGTSIIKLISVEEDTADAVSNPPPPPPGGEPQIRAQSGTFAARRTTTAARSMAGTIDEIPLPDLLQLLSTSKKSGVLEIQNEGNVGRIYMRQGQVYFATINDNTNVSPRKAVYRMLVWQSGGFELQPPDERNISEELDEPTEGLLMEAMRQLDEIKRLEDELPAPDSKLCLVRPLGKPLRELSPDELDVLQVIHNMEDIQQVLDHSPKTDLDTYTIMLDLLKAQVIGVKSAA